MNATNPRHLSKDDNVDDLLARMEPDDRVLHESFGHIFTEAAFVNRRFIVIKTKGKAKGGGPRTPEILGSVRLTSFEAGSEVGSRSQLLNEADKRTMEIGHVPVLLFGLPVFACIPVYQGLKWEAKEKPDGRLVRSLIWGVCFKQKSNVTFFNPDNVAVVTPNRFRELFGAEAPRVH